MNKYSFFGSLMLVGLLVPAIRGRAQNSNGGEWKKTVTRMIDLREPENSKKPHLVTVGQGNNLSELIIKDVLAGKINAYSNQDLTLNTKLPISDLNVMLGMTPDSVTMTDPVTGKEILRIVRRDVNYDAIQQFRLLEEWNFNPSTGKTNFQIAGLAPVREIYGPDGSMRGVQAMFYVKYADALSAIGRYDKAYPSKTFEMRIWDDNFLSDVKPAPVK